MPAPACSARFFTEKPQGLPGVDGVWCHTESTDKRAMALAIAERHFVPPDGCSDLIVHFSAGRLASSFVQAPTLSYEVVAIEPSEALFGVRLELGQGGPLLKRREEVAAETQRLIADVDPADAAGVLERLGRYGAGLLERYAAAQPAWVAEALSVAQRRSGDVSVLALARHVGVSERTIHRGFLDWVGGPPKQLLRAMRIREAVRRTEGLAALAEIAAELGFADQAHLSREMRQLWGTTPARLRSEPSDFFKTPPVSSP